MLKGMPASTGIGIGKAAILRLDEIVVIRRAVDDKNKEKQRFLQAVDRFCIQVSTETEAVSRNIGASEAGIISVQSVIARDLELREEVFGLIDRDAVSAEYAFSVVCDRYIELFSDLEDELMRARAADFRDIKNRFLAILLGIRTEGVKNYPPGTILVAEEISPSQAAMLDPARVTAIVTQNGTRFSHISIIVRALQIPAVVSVENACGLLAEGDELIVDGESGDVLRNPTNHFMIRYKARQQHEQKSQEELRRFRAQQTVTADGNRIRLDANLAFLSELCRISENNVDGIGLFRTEFLFMDKDHMPSEEEQFKAYKRVVQALAGKPVVIRTLDVGGDKIVSYLNQEVEANPFLGNRAVRFCLSHPDIFKVQLAALLRASAFGDLRIMFPMVCSLSELRLAKSLIEDVKQELSAQNISYNPHLSVGIMVETPASALCADALAKEADFFSVGTNDLTQYILAVDRDNESVASMYSPAHPAVLRTIRFAVESAHRAGIWVGVCGEAASDPVIIPLLVGMGVDELSVSSGALLGVRQQIAGVDSALWNARMDEVLELSSPSEVAEYVRTCIHTQNDRLGGEFPTAFGTSQ